MMSRILVLFLILIATPLSAQKDSLDAEYSMIRAKICLKEARWDSLEYYTATARQFFKSKNWLAPWLKTYSGLAYVWGEREPTKGVALLEQGMREKWREPSNAKEWEQYAMNLLAAGHILRVNAADEMGAKNYYEKTQEVFAEKLGEHSDRIARYLYHNLGNIYTRLGDYERAISLFRRSLNYNRLYPEAKVIDHGDLAIALNEVGQHQEALQIVRQGLEFKDLSSEQKISLYQNESDALFKLGQPEKALVSLERIPSLIQQMIAEEDEQYADNYSSQYHTSKAEILTAFKQYDQAQKQGLTAVKIGRAFWETEKRREIGKVYSLLGTICLEQNQARQALANFHHALYCVLPGLSLKALEQSPSPSKFYSENTILEALHGKARAFKALNQLEKALECYELIPFVEVKLRATHAYQSSSLLALKESRQRFQEAVDIAWMLFERSNGNPQYAERAFRLTELARGMLLLQSLVQARQYLPEDIRQKDYDLRVRMAWLEHEIAAEREKAESVPVKGSLDKKVDQKKITDWEDQLFSLKLERQKLLADFPAYNNPDSLFLRVMSAKDVSRLLRPGQAMVDYFLTESAAYIFSFDEKGDFRWRKTGLTDLFRTQTKQFAAYLAAGEESGRAAFLQQGWNLDSLLLASECKRWGASVNSLLIVPDDVLMLVPFDVLLSAAPVDQTPWPGQPWLLYKYHMGYAYSATLLGLQQGISAEHANAHAKPKQTFGGFAPSYADSSGYQLENTRPMVRYVCDLLGGDAWLGKASSEACFKKTAAGYRTILLAMHGISDNEHPELSCLRFGDPGNDSLVNNNILYASELQIMQLQADLVVLSACHSGSGKMEPGEGVFSLARAFAAARVPATVMSLWLLHENTAPPLIQAFFKYLQQGKTKDEALNLAKQGFLKNESNFEMSHPFFWAGLTAAGDMRALDLPLKPQTKLKWVWILLVLSLFGVAIWWRSRKKRSGNRLFL